MPLTAAAIAAAAAVEANGLLQAGADIAAGGEAEYIRAGQPTSIIPTVGLAMARQGCRRYHDNAANIPPDVAAKYEKSCRPYLANIGYGQEPAIEQPFSGGQCAGVTYRVTMRFYNPTTGATTGTTIRDGLGPVSIGVGGNQAPGVGGSCAAGQTYYPGRFLRFNGVADISFGGGCAVRKTWEVVSVVPLNNGNNDCGSPPPDIRQPIGPPTPGPPSEPFNPRPDININIGAIINANGTINFNIGTGPITIDPFGGGGSGTPGTPGTPGGGGLGGPSTPGDVGSPGAAANINGGAAAEGQAPAGKVLTGVKLNLLQAPASPTQYKEGVFRGTAYIRMGTAAGLDLNYAGQMLSTGQFVLAEKEYLTHWRVEVNRGYRWQVIPYYRDV